MDTSQHNHYISLALRLAEQGRFTVAPNPMVGCVIVKNNIIVGQGYHTRSGEPHAEIFALKEAGENAYDACAYVTLEPCCHQGKTPPCTTALINAGIKEIYVCCEDPNPLVAGKGIEILRSAGIHVEVGMFETDALTLNEIFFHYITQKRPFVIAKWAMSLNGKTIVKQQRSSNPTNTKCIPTENEVAARREPRRVHDAVGGTQGAQQRSCNFIFDGYRRISGVQSHIHTHQIRQYVDAILVGANTICEDNPQLTARFTQDANTQTQLKQPIRIILSGQKPLSKKLNVFRSDMPGKTIVATTPNTKHLVQSLQSHNVELLIVPENNDGQISLPELLNQLGKHEITSLLVEGGMRTHESFFRENLVNKIHVYLAPIFIGDGAQKKSLNITEFVQLDRDFQFTAHLGEKNNV